LATVPSHTTAIWRPRSRMLQGRGGTASTCRPWAAAP
jgi:hypothetical protein